MVNRVLIISSSANDIRMLKHALGNANDGPFDVESMSTLAKAMERIPQGGIDAILMDLMLPDGKGLACFDQIYEAARYTPILTLCKVDPSVKTLSRVI